jgi:hypothetical protein
MNKIDEKVKSLRNFFKLNAPRRRGLNCLRSIFLFFFKKQLLMGSKFTNV